MDEYRIPLQHERGTYDAAVLPHRGTCISIARTPFGALRYTHPEYGTEIIEYEVPADTTLFAVYAKSGHLLSVEYTKNGGRKTIWMRTGAACFQEFAETEARKISAQLLQCPQPAARLFFEWFYDGEAADFAAKTGTHADMAEIRARYGDSTDAINNCADYPAEKRIPCDTDTFRIMLLCTLPDMRETRFSDTVREMRRLISAEMQAGLQKTDDYRVIAEEYD